MQINMHPANDTVHNVGLPLNLTEHAPAAQQHVPSAGLCFERLVSSQVCTHLAHEKVYTTRKSIPEVLRQLSGIYFVDVERQRQQLKLGVGEDHGEVHELQ